MNNFGIICLTPLKGAICRGVIGIVASMKYKSWEFETFKEIPGFSGTPPLK